MSWLHFQWGWHSRIPKELTLFLHTDADLEYTHASVTSFLQTSTRWNILVRNSSKQAQLIPYLGNIIYGHENLSEESIKKWPWETWIHRITGRGSVLHLKMKYMHSNTSIPQCSRSKRGVTAMCVLRNVPTEMLSEDRTNFHSNAITAASNHVLYIL